MLTAEAYILFVSFVRMAEIGMRPSAKGFMSLQVTLRTPYMDE